jgi:hypothetical protein
MSGFLALLLGVSVLASVGVLVCLVGDWIDHRGWRDW